MPLLSPPEFLNLCDFGAVEQLAETRKRGGKHVFQSLQDNRASQYTTFCRVVLRRCIIHQQDNDHSSRLANSSVATRHTPQFSPRIQNLIQMIPVRTR